MTAIPENNTQTNTAASERPMNFLEQQIRDELVSGKHLKIVTRFPPEPNGYLHIGHAKSMCLNFGLAERFDGECNFRFDDTNPAKEDQEYIDAIIRDVEWLGFKWSGDIRYASNYFQQLHEWAVYLINQGKAYVCHLSAAETREYRGTLIKAGIDSPYRNRSVKENLVEFERMRAGEYDEGICILRAKIDMASPNVNMRDPSLYRIRKLSHHQTGDTWCIYPSYDFAHGQEDAIEGVTHSICTLEFADHRPLYEWFTANLPLPNQPRQYEFGRLNLDYTVTSKRKLKQLVENNIVDGWDDPRLPTLAGFRRRGVTPAAIRKFCEMIGVTKSDGVVEIGMLEHAIRDDLDKNAPRAMCVLKPIKLTLTNYAEAKRETMIAPRHPNPIDSLEVMATRELPFSRELLIDAADFREEANKKYKRLVIGKRVRLRNAYIIEADECVKDSSGNVVEVKARLIEGTLGSDPADGVKAKGVIHWVDAKRHAQCEVHLYDRLFIDPAPDSGGKDFIAAINPNSLTVLTGCAAEVGLSAASSSQTYQFEREGYFCRDSKTTSTTLIFNQTISLRDSFQG
jgi:glutaminyl-tRNA synthetase